MLSVCVCVFLLFVRHVLVVLLLCAWSPRRFAQWIVHVVAALLTPYFIWNEYDSLRSLYYSCFGCEHVHAKRLLQPRQRARHFHTHLITCLPIAECDRTCVWTAACAPPGLVTPCLVASNFMVWRPVQWLITWELHPLEWISKRPDLLWEYIFSQLQAIEFSLSVHLLGSRLVISLNILSTHQDSCHRMTV